MVKITDESDNSSMTPDSAEPSAIEGGLTSLSGTIFVCALAFSPQLVRCLTSLAQQRLSRGFTVEAVTIVWNASSAAAQRYQSQMDEWVRLHWGGPLRIDHESETRQGIPWARNKALCVAITQGLDWFAFIDDDCVAHCDWLQNLTKRAAESEADVVAGSWHIVSHGRPSSWLPRHIFGPKGYQRDGRPALDGEQLPSAYTRNVFVRLSAVTTASGRAHTFDESLSHRGGSDVMFFHRLSRAGSRIIYAEGAVVDEVYSRSRMTLGWQFRRRIRTSQSRLSRANTTGEKVVPSRESLMPLVHLLWRIPSGLLCFPLSVFSHRVRRFIGATVLSSAPYLAAGLHVIGVHYLEYADRFTRHVPFTGQKGNL